MANHSINLSDLILSRESSRTLFCMYLMRTFEIEKSLTRFEPQTSSLQTTGLSACHLRDLSHRHSHGHTVSQAQSELKYWSNWTICNRMYTAIAVAFVYRSESLMGTMCVSIVVQQDRVYMSMAILRMIHSLWRSQGMMNERTSLNSDSEQKNRG